MCLSWDDGTDNRSPPIGGIGKRAQQSSKLQKLRMIFLPIGYVQNVIVRNVMLDKVVESLRVTMLYQLYGD